MNEGAPEAAEHTAAPAPPTPIRKPSPSLLTVEQIIERAPSDLVEDVIEIPEWGGHVKVRSLSAAQNARIKQVSLDLAGAKGLDVAWAEMEKAQFREGVIDPKFSAAEADKLHELCGGVPFGRVISWLDRHSGTEKEELRKAQEEFRGSDD